MNKGTHSLAIHIYRHIFQPRITGLLPERTTSVDNLVPIVEYTSEVLITGSLCIITLLLIAICSCFRQQCKNLLLQLLNRRRELQCEDVISSPPEYKTALTMPKPSRFKKTKNDCVEKHEQIENISTLYKAHNVAMTTSYLETADDGRHENSMEYLPTYDEYMRQNCNH